MQTDSHRNIFIPPPEIMRNIENRREIEKAILNKTEIEHFPCFTRIGRIVLNWAIEQNMSIPILYRELNIPIDGFIALFGDNVVILPEHITMFAGIMGYTEIKLGNLLLL